MSNKDEETAVTSLADKEADPTVKNECKPMDTEETENCVPDSSGAQEKTSEEGTEDNKSSGSVDENMLEEVIYNQFLHLDPLWRG